MSYDLQEIDESAFQIPKYNSHTVVLLLHMAWNWEWNLMPKTINFSYTS